MTTAESCCLHNRITTISFNDTILIQLLVQAFIILWVVQLTSRQQNRIYYMIHQVHPKPLTLFDLITSSYFHITSLLKFLCWQLLTESYSRHCFQPMQSLARCPSTCNPLPNCTPHSDWCDWLHPIWSTFPITLYKSHFTWPGHKIFPYFSRIHCDVLSTYINQ